mmetsp:Transcript_99046/g.170556  ORF Transcript_99046/g.170556 Transcript_99046/m.170556 type:complete len:94 (-) Transcript_99046:118-399(-)
MMARQPQHHKWLGSPTGDYEASMSWNLITQRCHFGRLMGLIEKRFQTVVKTLSMEHGDASHHDRQGYHRLVTGEWTQNSIAMGQSGSPKELKL